MAKGCDSMKKNRRILLMPLILLLLIIYLAKPQAATAYTEGIPVFGSIHNQDDVEIAIKILKQNLQAATDKDLPAYLNSLVASAHNETSSDMSQFFADYNLSHELLSIEVLDQQPERMLLKASQRTKKQKGLPQKERYRDHLSDANHTLIKEGNQWKIAETVMTSTSFLD